MDDTLCLHQLRSCDLFRGLGEKELAALYAFMVKFYVKAGEVLVKQGDLSDSLYILLSGRLLVQTSAGMVVGQISRGQTVGEMGLITEEPRSANVLALRDALLLKLDNAHFHEVCSTYPSVLWEVARIITKRLQRTLQTDKQHHDASNIVIFKGHAGVDLPLFIKQLIETFDNKCCYRVLKREDFPPTLSTIVLHTHIQELEGQYDYLFYVVEDNHEWREVCLEHADRVFFVVNAGYSSALDDETLSILRSSAVHSYIKKILILLHPYWGPPNNTEAWLRLLNFSQHHHICIHQKKDFERLLRMINGSATGLVLGGGGARAWAQVGVIKYLFEKKIMVDAYAGTSAGAISAAVLAISRDYQDFLEASELITRVVKFNEYTIPYTSLLSSNSLMDVLQTIFKATKIEDFKKMFFCVAADLISSSEVVIQKGLVWRALRASSAIPGIYPPVCENGQLLVDGAVVNNVPVDIMRDYFEGLGKVITVDISDIRSGSHVYDYPLNLNWRWVMQNKFFSRDTDHKLPSIASILLRGMMLSSVQKSAINLKKSDICIRPNLYGRGFLDVKHRDELLTIGYMAAVEAFKNWPLSDNI